MRRLKNRKGFTLIELLAVIIILAILMTLAITAMSGYIRNARKDTFRTTALQYANAARLSFVNGDYDIPARGQCLVIKTNSIALESGSHESSFGQDFTDNSYVIIHNSSSTGQDKYDYYLQMEDNAGNGFGVILETDLERDHVIEKDVDGETNFQPNRVAPGGSPSANSTITLYKGQGTGATATNGSCTVSQVVG